MDIDNYEPLILDMLTRACSQNPCILKPAEQQLQEWHILPGFYTALSSIFSNHEIDVNVRWMAILYIKNGVDRYWRKTAPNAMQEGEKELIRKRLLSNFHEPCMQIGTQMAVLIGKIARLDCPRDWPSLLPTILLIVRCGNQQVQERALMVLHHVVKTLASKRLAPDRKLFEDLTNEIFSYIYRLWTEQLAKFIHLSTMHSDEMAPAVDRAILSLRILRRLVTFGFRDPAESQEAMSFLNQVFVKLDAMLECRQSLWGNHIMLDKCEKFINILSKVLLDSLDQHPVCYMQFITRTLEFVVKYNFAQPGLLYERFTVNCFNLMKNILICDMYRPGKQEIEPDSVKMQAHHIKTSFFGYQILSDICQSLISQYFLLNHEDLDRWDKDPEEFLLGTLVRCIVGYIGNVQGFVCKNIWSETAERVVGILFVGLLGQQEVGDTYKYSLRPCTETLFLSLFKEYRMTLKSVLLKMVEHLDVQCDENNMITILRKDAVYNAIGLTAFDLFDDIEFDNWFTTHLLAELKISHLNYRIIRRRVIWLIGKWVGVKLSSSLRPILYEAICQLLQPSEDLVVRLEAANTLKCAVDDFEFKVEQFLQYLEVLFSLLFELLKDVQECDSKMQVLNVISYVIERIGVLIRPYVTSLVYYLPSLWEQSKEHNMLKCAILTTLIHLVQGFGTHSYSMYNFLLPVIELSTDTSKPEHVYLMEDGLELWLVTLMNANKVTPELLQLYNNMPKLLELSTEHLRVCLKVIEEYLLIGPQEFMQAYSTLMVKSLSSLVTELRTEGIMLVLKVIDLVFLSFPKEGPQLFNLILLKFFKSIIVQDEQPMVICMYVTLIGRIIVQNQEYFWNLLDQFAAEVGESSSLVLKSLLLAWTVIIDEMTQPERRKLLALAMASLLTVNNSVIMENFGNIIAVCVQVLHDVCRVPVDEETVIQLDALVIADSDEHGEDEYPTEHKKRKRSLSRKDPVHSMPLKDYVFQQLEHCHNLHGAQVFDSLTQKIDADIYLQLLQFAKK